MSAVINCTQKFWQTITDEHAISWLESQRVADSKAYNTQDLSRGQTHSFVQMNTYSSVSPGKFHSTGIAICSLSLCGTSFAAPP